VQDVKVKGLHWIWWEGLWEGQAPLGVGWGGGYDMAGLLDFDISGILVFCMQMNLQLEDHP